MIRSTSRLKALAAALLGGTALTMALPQSEADAACTPPPVVPAVDCTGTTTNHDLTYPFPIRLFTQTNELVTLGKDGNPAFVTNDGTTTRLHGNDGISIFEAAEPTGASIKLAPVPSIMVDTLNTGTPSTITAAPPGNGISISTIFGTNILIGQNSAGGKGLNANVTGGNGDGILASATVGGNISIATAGNITGNSNAAGIEGHGIHASTDGGNINITTAGNVTGNSTAFNFGAGIFAQNLGGGNINITTTGGTVTGNSGNGIEADTGAGTISITTAGNVTGNSTATAFGVGILAKAMGGNINITTTAGNVTGNNGNGIDAETGAGSISITTAGNVTGNSSGARFGSGIFASTTGGNVNITTTAGNVTGNNGDGIFSKATGAGNINITTAGNITGNNGFGIQTAVAGGKATINVGRNSTISGSMGPLSLTGTSIVNNAGTLRVGDGGAISDELANISNSGNLIVDMGGHVTVGGITNNAAGVITNNGAITDALNNSGLVNNNGIYTASVNNFSTGTINNNGVWNAATFTNNAGGTVTTTGTLVASTSISNDGIFNAQGTLTTPVLTNTGIFHVTGPLAGMLTTFNNAGTVSLVNGIAGDILKTTNFNGLGGNLAIDVNPAAGKADELVVTNLTGTTRLKVNLIGNSVFITSPIPVIAATTVAPGTVVSVSGPTSLISFQLQQSAGDPTFSLTSTVNAGAAGAIPAGIHAILTSLNTGFFSGNLVQNGSAFIGEPTDPVPNQINGGPWVRFAGGQNDVRATILAQDTTTPSKVRTNFNGFQVGVDLGVANVENTGWNTHLGLTGGLVAFTTNDLLLSDVGSSNHVPFMGIYGAVNGHGFFADFQVRKDFYDMQLNNAAASLAGSNLNGAALSANGSAGYHFELPQSWFIEPSGALVYSQLHVNSLLVSINPATGEFGEMDFNPVNSLLGRLGLRAGTTYVCEPLQLALQPFGSASVWHEFEGDTQTNFVLGGASVPLGVTPIGTFGQLGLGMSAQVLKTGFLGFVRADWRFGENVSGYDVVGGLRYQF